MCCTMMYLVVVIALLDAAESMRGGNTQQRWSLRDGVRIKVAAAYSVPNGDDDRPWNNIIPHASIKIGGLDIG